MENKFKRNLIVGYSISILLLLISSVASFVSIRSLLKSAGEVNHTNQVLHALNDVLSAARDAETGQRGFLLTGDERFLTLYYGAHEAALRSVALAKRLTQDEELKTAAQVLKDRVDDRFSILESLLNIKKRGDTISTANLIVGKNAMDRLRSHINLMEQKEQELLAIRTKNLDRFTGFTPVLIIIASMLSLLITVISFGRVTADFEKKERLQKQLEQKDKETNNRIAVIQGIAETISAGDYKIRITDEKLDMLGGLAVALNNMAASLEDSFTKLAEREWLHAGIAALSNEVVVEKEIVDFSQGIIALVAEHTNSISGAFYLRNDEGLLQLHGGYALMDFTKKELLVGEGIAGQCAASSKIILVNDIVPEDYILTTVAGRVKAKSVMAVPLIFNKEVRGVIELSSMETYTDRHQAYLELFAASTSIAINTAQNRQRVQNLLKETQVQSEELQSQHEELENINAQLRLQAEKLQSSEEELRVQQEELQQANMELEERSRLLEEKNELVLERNLAIQAKSAELTLSTKYKSEFLANMSHELRTPLNSVLLLSRLLSENHEGNLSADQIEYARVIQNSGNGLLRLIDEILDLSKIEAGKMELEYSDVNIQELVKEFDSLFSPIAKDKGVTYKTDVDKNAPVLIETDRLRVEQIVRNLISNALKFTKKGFVQLAVSQQNNMLAFTVTDTGIGIPKEKQQTIFEAFQQADGSTRRQFGGTGLGLSISRELAKLLGGEIKITSKVEKGSVFTFLVPLQKPVTPNKIASLPQVAVDDEQEKDDHDGANKMYVAQHIPEAIPDDRGTILSTDKVILIIEDDTGFARSLLDFTRKQGYKGIVSVRGDEGITLAQQYKPLGILLDIQLPVKSGWEVIDVLKNNPATKSIPVHIMSSLEARTKSLSKGAVDFINKPVAFEKMTEMFKKIEDALTRHPKKVLIIEENEKHAKALAYFLESFNVTTNIGSSVNESINALTRKDVDCVILDMGVPTQKSYDTLEIVKKTPGLENLPIIVFTGKNLSQMEEMRIKQYADSIVVKTAHSYQRILDEVSLFLHLVAEQKQDGEFQTKKPNGFTEVLKDKIVLIADDDVRNIFSMTKALERQGIIVLSATDGKDALEQLEKNQKVDLVLMDMMMPEMDGYESTRRIRKNLKYKDLPVIAVTAKAMTGDREKCIEAGASDYITKPVDVDQLVSLLRVWLYD